MMNEFLQVGDVFSCDVLGLDGTYIVIATALTGGGQGHGVGDIYPDGWRVTAKALVNEKWDEDAPEVKFYQSGAFYKMITPNMVKKIRKMKMQFV